MTAINSLQTNVNSASGVQQAQTKSGAEKELNSTQSTVESVTASVANISLTQSAASASTAAPLPTAVSVVKLTQAQVKEILINETVKTMQKIVQGTFNRLQSFQKDPDQLRAGIFYSNSFAQVLKQVNTPESLAEWTKLRENGHFFIGLAPEKYFIPCRNKKPPFYKHTNLFVVKAGVKPSEALDALIKGPSLLACGEVCEIARYQALRAVLKDEKFDQLLANDGNNSNPFKIGYIDESNLIKLLSPVVKRDDIQTGDLVHITNVKKFHIKHANGDAGGYNLICAEGGKSPKYLGFGLDPKRVTAEQVGEKLLEAYNDDPIDDQLILTEGDLKAVFQNETKEEFRARKQIAKDKMKLHKFKKEGGGRTLGSTEFDVLKVMLLASATAEKGRKLLQMWADERKKAFCSRHA